MLPEIEASKEPHSPVAASNAHEASAVERLDFPTSLAHVRRTGLIKAAMWQFVQLFGSHFPQ